MTIVVLLLYAISYLRNELDLARPATKKKQSMLYLPNLLFSIFLITVIIDGTPVVVDYLRHSGVLRTSIDWDSTYSRILNNLLIYGSAVAFAARFLFNQKKLRPNAIKYSLLAITWTGLFLSVVLIVNRIHYGRPPSQLSLFIPFISAILIFASALHIILRQIMPIKTLRLIFSAVISVLIAGMLLYFYMLPYSIHVRQASKKIGELTRPITPFVEAISERSNSWEKEFDPSEINIFEELKKGKRKLESYSGLTWKEEIDNQDNLLVSFLEKTITPYLYDKEKDKKLMMTSGERNVTLEWNLLSPVRPFEYDDAIDYLENFSRIEQISISKRNTLREVQEVFAKKQLLEAIVRKTKSDQIAHEEIVCDIAKNLEINLFELNAVGSLLKKVYPDIQNFPGLISNDFFSKITSANKREKSDDSQNENGISLELVKQHMKHRLLDGETVSAFLKEAVSILNDIQGHEQPASQRDFDRKIKQDSLTVKSSDTYYSSNLSDGYIRKSLIEAVLIAYIRESKTRFNKTYTQENTSVSNKDLEILLDSLVGDSCINSQGRSTLPSIGLADFKNLLNLESYELGCLIVAISLDEDDSKSSFLANEDELESERERDHRIALRNVVLSNVLSLVGKVPIANSLFKAKSIDDVLESLFGNGKPQCDIPELKRAAEFILLHRAIGGKYDYDPSEHLAQEVFSELCFLSVPNSLPIPSDSEQSKFNNYESELVMLSIYKLRDKPLVSDQTLSYLLCLTAVDFPSSSPGHLIRRAFCGMRSDLVKTRVLMDQLSSATFFANAITVILPSLAVFLVGAVFVDPNITSLHGAFRDSISNAFLFDVIGRDKHLYLDPKLSQLADYQNSDISPFPIINATLNLASAASDRLKDRNACIFTFTPEYIGAWCNSSIFGESADKKQDIYIKTAEFERFDPNFTLASATAISAAAVAPNMGRYTSWSVRFAMVIANIRLGYWIWRLDRIVIEEKTKVYTHRFDNVLTQERSSILKRRKNIGLSDSDSKGEIVFGLAFSGGGIRSAAFSLGVAQSLDSFNLWRYFDYLSTVSGGGFTGSSILNLIRSRKITDFSRNHLPSDGGQSEGSSPKKQQFDYLKAVSQFFYSDRKFSCCYNEILGRLHPTNGWWNISDGGHLENLGVYSLLQRKCDLIVVSDGEDDHSGTFDGLTRLLLLAENDLKVKIDFFGEELERLTMIDGLTRSHFTVGLITYPSEKQNDPPKIGWLIYLRASITGDEEPIIANYRKANERFPNETTADQFFNEHQFEAYRRLGVHIGALAFGTIFGIDAESRSYSDLKDIVGRYYRYRCNRFPLFVDTQN